MNARRPTPLRPRVAAELLRSGRTVDLPLGGASMRPLLAPGDMLRAVPARASDVRPGDVLVVETDGRLLCHRLIYATATALVLRGDDSPRNDPPCPHAALVGRVVVRPSPRALYAAVRALARSCGLAVRRSPCPPSA